MNENELVKQPQTPEQGEHQGQHHRRKKRGNADREQHQPQAGEPQRPEKILLPDTDKLSGNFSAVLDEDEGYLPPTKEDYKNILSSSLVTDGRAEAASALLMGTLAALAETQLGLGIGHYILMQAMIFGVLKEAMTRQLTGQYNQAQSEFAQRREDQQTGYLVEESQPIERLPLESMLTLAKSIAAPFLAYEVIQNFSEIMGWAGENPLFVISIVGILVGVAGRNKIANSLLNAYRGIKEGFANAANNFIDFASSIRLQSPAYEMQNPVTFQKPVEFQSPIKSVQSPIKETRPWFKFRWPFYSNRNRENDQEKAAENPQT